MSDRKSSIRRFIPLLVCTGSLLTGLPVISMAQTNPGFSFVWGDGPERKQQLGYVLEYGTPGHRQDRYRLQIKRQKVAISSILITYPDYYKGKFSPGKISLRYSPKNRLFNLKKGKEIPASATLDEENRVIEIIPEDVIPAGSRTEVVLSNVRNPNSGGMYFFDCRITSPGDIPLNRYIGTWVLSIFRT